MAYCLSTNVFQNIVFVNPTILKCLVGLTANYHRDETSIIELFYSCMKRGTRDHFLTGHFTISEPLNPPIHIFKLHKLRGSRIMKLKL